MRRCVFLDRDGVINRRARVGEYIRTWEEFELVTPVVDWIRLFNALDFLVIVVTNQRGVALKQIAPEDLELIHRNMRQLLVDSGARIDDVFCCPHEKDACECRKPKPGMVFEAARKWNINLSQSLMIGDSPSDREMAERSGLGFVAVDHGVVVELPASRQRYSGAMDEV
jgi:D-glycero-D-manno-heptose 1,7-bisphosphate phosphatase